MTGLLEHIRVHAAADTELIALDDGNGGSLRYRDLAFRVAGTATRLLGAFAPDVPAVLREEDGIERAVLELALFEAGIPVLALPLSFTAEQADRAIADCGAQAWPPGAPRTAASRRRSAPSLRPIPPGTARITFAPGSTEGVFLSARQVLALAEETGGEQPAAGLFATLIAGRTYRCHPRKSGADFFTALEAATAHDRQTVLQRRIPPGREAYLASLTRTFHRLSHIVPLMCAARERLGHRPELLAALDDHIAAEEGQEEWVLADIAAAGGDADAARRSDPDPASWAMVSHAYRLIEQGNPVAVFGMIYALESASGTLARNRIFDAHEMASFAALMNGLDDPEDREAVIGMAQDILRLSDELELERKNANAPGGFGADRISVQDVPVARTIDGLIARATR